MTKPVVLALQSMTACAEAAMGAWFVADPAGASERFQLCPSSGETSALVSFVGMLLFSLGLCGAIGSLFIWRRDCPSRIQTVWLLGTIFRCGAVTLIVGQVLSGSMPISWFGPAIALALIAGLQASLLCFTSSGRFQGTRKHLPPLKHADRLS